MNKKVKRMRLNRETLLHLEDRRLGEAAGAGTSPKECCSTCTASFSCPPPPTGAEETCLC
jgi:hypothetical protein